MAVVDADVGTMVAGNGAFLGTAGSGDDARAYRPAHLNCSEAHSARGGEYQQRLACLKARPPGECAVGGAVGNPEMQGRSRLDPVGQRINRGFGADRLPGVAASADEREHALAGLAGGNAGRRFDHATDDFRAGDEGQGRLDLVLAGNPQADREAQARHLDGNAYAVKRKLRGRKFLDPQVVVITETMADKCAHTGAG